MTNLQHLLKCRQTIELVGMADSIRWRQGGGDKKAGDKDEAGQETRSEGRQELDGSICEAALVDAQALNLGLERLPWNSQPHRCTR